HKRRRTRLPRNLSRGCHAPFQIVPRHMQLPDGSINPFLPGHLNSSRPKLRGYSGFPAAMASPFLETPSCFFQTDNRGLATCHGLPPRRGLRRQNDLNSYLAAISCRLAGNSHNYTCTVNTHDHIVIFHVAGHNSHTHSRPVALQPQTLAAEVFESYPICAAVSAPGLAELRTSRKAGKQHRPAPIVRMLPKIVQSQIQEHVLHQLKNLKARGAFIRLKWACSSIGSSQFPEKSGQQGVASETVEYAVQSCSVLQK